MFLDKYGADKDAIVRNITRAFAHQIFVDGFYTADPHPGKYSPLHCFLTLLIFSTPPNTMLLQSSPFSHSPGTLLPCHTAVLIDTTLLFILYTPL